jgi:hypothetical protein
MLGRSMTATWRARSFRLVLMAGAASCGGTTFSAGESVDASILPGTDAAPMDSPVDGASERSVGVDAPAQDGAAEPIDAANDETRPALDAGPSYRGAVLADGPVAYWRMNIASGSVVPDESGHHDDLLLQGTGHMLGVAGAIAGDTDHAIGFDGVDSHAIALRPRDLDFAASAPFTVECWARRDRTVDGGSGEYFQQLVSAAAGGPPNRNGYLLYLLPSDANPDVPHTSFEYDAPDRGQTGAEGPLGAASSWIYFVATFDGTKASLYVDGTLASSRAVEGSITARTSDFVVGREGATGRYHFAGAIDEVAVYDKALTVLQITNHRDLALRR